MALNFTKSHGSSSGKTLLRVLDGDRQWPPPIWLMRQAGRYLPEYRAVRASVSGFLELCLTPQLAAQVTVQPIHRYGFDAAILFADILLVPWALGQALDFVEGEGPKLAAVGNGRMVAGLARNGIEAAVARLAPVCETIDLVKQQLPVDTALIGFAGGPWTVACYMVEGGGSKDFAAAKRFAYGDPEAFGRLIDMITEATTQYLLAQIDAGAEVIQLFESWAGLLPETGFERWVIGPTARIVAALHQYRPKIPVIGFPRGAGLLYERFVAETAVDAVGLDSCVPLAWASHRLQPQVPVQGNLDPAILLAGGDALGEETERVLRLLGNGPYIFNLGHGVILGTPPEHVAQLVEQVRSAGGTVGERE